MRTLTLGVLIVSGGTLAALPFRRYQAIPDASSAPLHVTGPTQSTLDASLPETAEFDARKFNVLASSEFSSKPSDGPSGDLTVGVTHMPPVPAPITSPQIHAKPREIDIPLTYQDLERPLAQPVAIQQRFSATAVAREKQLDQERVAGLVMPAMEALTTSQQEEFKRVAQSVSPNAETARAAGSLASSLSRDQQIEPLPNAQPVEHPRHWIRQPN